MKNKVGKIGVSITMLALLTSVGSAQTTNAPPKDVTTSTSTNQVSATSTNAVAATAAATAGAATATALEKEAAASASSAPAEKPQPEPKELEKAPAKDRDWMDFIVGVGMVYSPELGDSIDDMYPGSLGYINTDDYSDYSGWLDLYIGLEVRPVNRFGIIVGLDTMIGPSIDVSGGTENEEYTSILFVPSVYGQFYFTQSRRFYVNAGVNLPIAVTESDYYNFEGDGVGFGANIGVELAGFVRIEGGYSYIPVTVKATSKNSGPNSNFSGSYNYGGPQIRVLFAF